MKTTLVLLFFLVCQLAPAQNIAFSFDDPHTRFTPKYTATERNDSLLHILKKHHLQAALFVCGHRLADADGQRLLQSWDEQDHLIANHSWSHFYFHGKSCTLQKFRADFWRNDSLIRPFKNYTKLFRFPYLKEGNTLEKREGMRTMMDSAGYRNGYVSIDASDWYIDSEMIRSMDSLKNKGEKNLEAYKAFYLQHIYERALYYDSLSTGIWGRKIKHVLLLHHNLLNALFLEDLIRYFEEKGWNWISASEAYQDPVYSLNPEILPAGESIVWAVAKQSGLYEKRLRYPAEDSEYEKEKLRKFLREYKN